MAVPKKILILTADAGFSHRAAANAVAELAWEAAQQCVVRRDHPFGRQIPLLQRILRGLDLGCTPGKPSTRADA
jgi:hypothetical protein